MSPTSSNCMKSIHRDHQPLIEFSKQKFRRIADYIYIYIYKATRSKQPMQPLRPIDQLDQSIGACIMHSHLLSVHSSTGSQQPCHVIGWLHTLARYHLIVMCGKQCMIPPNTSACMHHFTGSQQQCHGYRIVYWVSSFKECVRASVRSTPRNPCVTRQHIIYVIGCLIYDWVVT